VAAEQIEAENKSEITKTREFLATLMTGLHCTAYANENTPEQARCKKSAPQLREQKKQPRE
jgi:hypothetical protein